MNITMAKARKLCKDLEKKYPNKACAVDIVFNSWSETPFFTAYVEDSDIKCTKHHHDIVKARKEFKLD